MSEPPRLTYLTGTVQAVNDARTALQLEPPGDWYRISKYADSSVGLLRKGCQATIGLDKTGWVRTADIQSAPAVENRPSNANLTPPAGERPFVSTERREGHILRQTALKCAVDWAVNQVEDYGPEEIIGFAEAFLSWLADDQPSSPTGRATSG